MPGGEDGGVITQEVLAPPEPPHRPVRRLLVIAAVVVLAGLAVVSKLSGGDGPDAPSAASEGGAPGQTSPTPTECRHCSLGTQIFVTRRTGPPARLDGEWVTGRRAGPAIAIQGDLPWRRVTLFLHDPEVVVWLGNAEDPVRRLLQYHLTYPGPHLIRFEPDPANAHTGDTATYRWTLFGGDHLRFAPVAAAGPVARELTAVTFERR